MEPEPKAPGPGRRSRSIGFFLTLLAIVAFVPLLTFAVVLLQRNNAAQQEVVETLIGATTEAIGQSVDRQVEGMITTLKVLASTPGLSEADFPSLQQRGTNALQGTGAYVAMIDASDNLLFSTRVPFGTELGRAGNAKAIQQAIDTGSIIVSGIYKGDGDPGWSVPIYMPVKLADGSTDVMVVSQDADNLASALVSRQLPAGWQVALVDAANKVITSSDTKQASSGKPFFIPPNEKRASSKWARPVIDGEAYVTSRASSITTGWTVVAWARASAVDGPLDNALIALVAGGLIIICAGGLATFFLAREIRRSVRGLANDARRLGLGEPVAPRQYPISEVEVVSQALVQAAQRRQSAEAEVRFLMREVAHRSKNQMTVIAAMAKQTARSAESVKEFVASFERRIFGLARSTDLLLAHGVAGVDLRELLQRQIDPFCPTESGRVTVDGPACRLNTQAAQILGMAAHELATNAVKYGAFSHESGTLAVRWTLDDEKLRLTWKERVATPTEPSGRRGFGTTVLENMVGSALGAGVERHNEADGMRWSFEIARAVLDPTPPPDTERFG